MPDLITKLHDIDPEFRDLVNLLYPQVVSKGTPDTPDVHVNDEKQGKGRKALAAGLLLGAAAEGAGTARAVSAARKVVSEGTKPAVEVSGGKLKRVLNSPAGRVGEAAVQAANLGIGVTAAAELARKPKNQQNGTLTKRAGMIPRRPTGALNDPMRVANRIGRLRKLPQMGASGLSAVAVGKRDDEIDLGTIEKSSDDLVWTGEISKFDEERRQVFGWCSLATVNGEVVVDRQQDYIPLSEIEKSAYDYMLNSRKGGDMHRRVSKFSGGTDEPLHTADVIESFVVTPEKLSAMGLPDDALPHGWWIGMKVHDEEQWQLVKDGKRSGFSIHGKGVRKEVAADAVAKADAPVDNSLQKRLVPIKERRKLAHKGDAMPDGSFPMKTKQDVLNAQRAIGRTNPAKRPRVEALIHRREKAKNMPITKSVSQASAFGVEHLIEKAAKANEPEASAGRGHFGTMRAQREGHYKPQVCKSTSVSAFSVEHGGIAKAVATVADDAAEATTKGKKPVAGGTLTPTTKPSTPPSTPTPLSPKPGLSVGAAMDDVANMALKTGKSNTNKNQPSSS